MKRVLFLLLLSVSIVDAQNVTISPGGITPALTGTYPRISYDAILALPSPTIGDMAYDITFLCLRVYNGNRWVCTYQLPGEPVNGAFIAAAGGTSDDNASSAAVDALGNVYVAGGYSGTATFGNTNKTSKGGSDIFVAKYNANGVLQWVQSAGGELNDHASSIALDASGNVYVAGYYSGTATFGNTSKTSKGADDIFVAKYDPVGVSWSWVQSAGGTWYNYASSIAIDALGNVYVAGYCLGTATFGNTSTTGKGGYDIFVAKYNVNGVLQWVQSAGGELNDYANSIAIDAVGNVYVAGYYQGTITFGNTSKTSKGAHDIFVAKYSANGTLQWVQSAGGTLDDMPTSAVVDALGNVYVAGDYQGTITFGNTSKTSEGGSDIFVARISQ
jgi:hypothetical protein